MNRELFYTGPYIQNISITKVEDDILYFTHTVSGKVIKRSDTIKYALALDPAYYCYPLKKIYQDFEKHRIQSVLNNTSLIWSL